MNRRQYQQTIQDINTNTEGNGATLREAAHVEYIVYMEGLLEKLKDELKTDSKYYNICRNCGQKFDMFGTECTCHDLSRVEVEGIAYPDGTVVLSEAYENGNSIDISNGMISSRENINPGFTEIWLNDDTCISVKDMYIPAGLLDDIRISRRFPIDKTGEYNEKSSSANSVSNKERA